jgi:pyruvate,water dikinase
MKNIVSNIRSMFGLTRREKVHSPPFELVFRRFREVLENNNRALEIITDMGDKLGGDYLFDIVYVKKAYTELSSSVRRSIQLFDSLTGNSHPAFHDVFERIDNRVKGMIYESVPSSVGPVLFLDDVSWDLSGYVGGKNAGAAELKNYLKLNVPETFAVTTRAYDLFMRHSGLDALVEQAARDNTFSEGLRDLVMNAPIPEELSAVLAEAVGRVRERCGSECCLAVRSSAEEEDGEFSFAGQFETVLNVPLETAAVIDAYKRVVASLFSAGALSYQKNLGFPPGKIKMAASCMIMVNAAASGVVYSSNPDGDRDTLVVTAAPGLGTAIVEGKTDADFFLVRKDAPANIEAKRAGRKETMVISQKGGGTAAVPVPQEQREAFCLSDGAVREIAGIALSIERHFRKPMDIEWALDGDGKIYILQARPLRMPEDSTRMQRAPQVSPELHEILMKDQGVPVQKGAGGGMVFVAKKAEDLSNFPMGAVLVARHDSSDFVRVMPFAAAIITDIGTPTSHMASLCREFKVPTVVNTGEATSLLKNGEKVTLLVDDAGGMKVYAGVVRELIESAGVRSMKMEGLYEYRKRRYILRYIAPLNLVDPLLDNFVPEGCKTMHDVLRFIHEKSVAGLIEGARYGDRMLKKHAAIRLDIPIPAGIIVIDIGGGLAITEGKDRATFEDIASVPLRAVVGGMMHPGVWHSEAVALKVNDFLSSMMRMPDITADRSEYVGYNVAVVSKEYMNLSLRFGYHFNMLDCYCSETARYNHIYFRFVGGATDISKRSRRIQLIAAVLQEYGFNIKIKGDLIIARLANIRRNEMEIILDQAGRLIAFTRQLDAVLHDDDAVERYRKRFMEGNYDI